ncbi:uncharacterized protein LOC132556658 [Ylistrum balloti]|uniref:uncharacterized protein LOC132556658 n=1 Tax=Ylistrum balloti TaxID=509963 RepID=UPI002905B9DD|nr:uncharacterized protein LOC132556658 [Ylistrum balloti]
MPTLILDPGRARKELGEMLNEELLGVRIESGLDPENPSETIISLVIVRRISGKVCIFDVLKSPSILHDDHFQALMARDRPLKVMFHPEHDSKLLWQFSRLRLHGVFDPQTLYLVKESIEMKLPTRKLHRKNLTDLCRLCHVECHYDKRLVNKMLRDNPSLFMERPCSDRLLNILMESAKCLILLYEETKCLLDVAVLQEKYSQMLDECLYGGIQGSETSHLKRQKMERNYYETKRFRKKNGSQALTKGDKELLRRGRLTCF